MRRSVFVLTCAAIVLAAALHVRHALRSVDRYYNARHTEFLLVTDHGQSTAVPFIRRNAAGERRVFAWTAAHAVKGNHEIKGRILAGGVTPKNFPVVVLRRSESLDLALLYLPACDPDNFQSAIFEDDRTLGDPVYHCGNFLGENFPGSVSTGIISNFDAHPSKGLTGWPWQISDTTTCLIVHGSSGGPLFCERHNAVIGIVVGFVPDTSIHIFVPVRAMQSLSADWKTPWAINSHLRAPTDAELNALASADAVVKFPLPFLPF